MGAWAGVVVGLGALLAAPVLGAGLVVVTPESGLVTASLAGQGSCPEEVMGQYALQFNDDLVAYNVGR